ncbi:MAG: hypothetical protein ACYTF1_26610 [Planctomycetota bacterium]|jgi:hypothetical protein
MRKKCFIGLVLASLVLAVPALAGTSNGFESDYCYALSDHGTIDMLRQSDGANVGSLPIGGATFCFSNSQVAGANSPAGARLFVAREYDISGNGKADEITISEYDSAANELRRTYLGRWWHGAPNKTLSYDSTKPLKIGTIRYNPVNDTLIVSANTGNKHKKHPPSKAWEFLLPDWPGAAGGVQLINEYTLLGNYKNRTNIAINPNDGMMYATGYNYGSGESGWRCCIGETPTNPVDPNYGVNTKLLDGTMYRDHCYDNQHYQMSAIAYREWENAVGDMIPEINTSNESTWTVYQPYAWVWGNGICVGNPGDTEPHPLLGRVGTPGADIAPACNRIRGIRANTDPYTGELFMVGNGGRTGNGGGVLQVKPIRPQAGSLILGGQGSVYADADSPMPDLVLEVDLDIFTDPADPNELTQNVGNKGRLPVAILGSNDYDVNEIDLSSLNIAGTVFPVKTPKIEKDENGDGILDLVVHFSRREVILALDLLDPPTAPGTVVEITVDGALLSGRAMFGTDSVTMVARSD